MTAAACQQEETEQLIVFWGTVTLAEPYRTFVMPGTAYGYANHFRLGAGGDDTDELISGLEQVGRCLSELEE